MVWPWLTDPSNYMTALGIARLSEQRICIGRITQMKAFPGLDRNGVCERLDLARIVRWKQTFDPLPLSITHDQEQKQNSQTQSDGGLFVSS